ncbi:hypothetical protein QJQ45_018308 [Haematococcus lacustris]|nr:hypothetical protein QJQ45_018308 [Haematococcus lacustris]
MDCTACRRMQRLAHRPVVTAAVTRAYRAVEPVQPLSASSTPWAVVRAPGGQPTWVELGSTFAVEKNVWWQMSGQLGGWCCRRL